MHNDERILLHMEFNAETRKSFIFYFTPFVLIFLRQKIVYVFPQDAIYILAKFDRNLFSDLGVKT